MRVEAKTGTEMEKKQTEMDREERKKTSGNRKWQEQGINKQD